MDGHRQHPQFLWGAPANCAAAHPQRHVHGQQSSGAGQDEEVGLRQRQPRVERRVRGLGSVDEVKRLWRAGRASRCRRVAIAVSGPQAPAKTAAQVEPLTLQAPAVRQDADERLAWMRGALAAGAGKTVTKFGTPLPSSSVPASKDRPCTTAMKPHISLHLRPLSLFEQLATHGLAQQRVVGTMVRTEQLCSGRFTDGNEHRARSHQIAWHVCRAAPHVVFSTHNRGCAAVTDPEQRSVAYAGSK